MKQKRWKLGFRDINPITSTLPNYLRQAAYPELKTHYIFCPSCVVALETL